MCPGQVALPALQNVQFKDPNVQSLFDGHAAAVAIASALECVARHSRTLPRRTDFTVFDSANVPKISIEDYAVRLIRLQFSPECFSMASVFIHHLIAMKVVPTVTFRNVHRLLLCSVLVAAKMQDDDCFSNKAYAEIGGISCAELNALEARLLTGIGWRVRVSVGEINEAMKAFKAGSNLEPEVMTRQVAKGEDEESTGGTGECPGFVRVHGSAVAGWTDDFPESKMLPETEGEKCNAASDDDNLFSKYPFCAAGA